jgi:hypothetical protein
LIEDCELQAQAVADFFDELNTHMDRMPTAAGHGIAMKQELLSETSA